MHTRFQLLCCLQTFQTGVERGIVSSSNSQPVLTAASRRLLSSSSSVLMALLILREDDQLNVRGKKNPTKIIEREPKLAGFEAKLPAADWLIT